MAMVGPDVVEGDISSRFYHVQNNIMIRSEACPSYISISVMEILISIFEPLCAIARPSPTSCPAPDVHLSRNYIP